MEHTYKEKLISSIEKVEIIYMDNGTSGFMASKFQEPGDISRLHFHGYLRNFPFTAGKITE
jgi:hypothetical protein